ncbi:MAG TPA: preprotein translocase subunit SecG, partial [Bacteroidia bacterium]|nr:preprotein translocase subunit SecG [Bacteroidia bacterium]
MSTLFGILSIIAAILLILIVVVQNSKGGGLSSALGASNITNVIGTRRATQDIEKYTWYLLASVMLLAFLANVTNAGKTVTANQSFESLLNAPSAPTAPAPTAPA